MADCAEGLPTLQVKLVEEPREDPRFRRHLLHAAQGQIW